MHNGLLEGLHGPIGGYVAPHFPLRSPHSTSFFPCVALVMPFSRDTLLELNVTLTRWSGAKSLRDPLASQLPADWVASSPLAKARWHGATEGAQLPLIRNKQIEAVKQYASVLFPAPELIGLLMDLNVPKGGFRHGSEFMTRRGAANTAATGLPFPRPIPSRDRFMDTWKELVKPLTQDRRVSVADPPTSGRSWPLQSWAAYIQLHPPPVDIINWKPPLSFLLRGDAYPCAGGSWTQLSIGLLNHGARGRTPAYLWATCGDKDMAALATRCSKNLQVYGRFASLSFLR